MAIQKLEKQESVGPRQPLSGDRSGYPMAYHPVPVSWFLEPWQLGRQFYDAVKFGIVQYVSLLEACRFHVYEPPDDHAQAQTLNFSSSPSYPWLCRSLRNR